MRDSKQIKNKIIAKLFTKYPSLLHRWAQKTQFVEFEDSPWTRLSTDVARSRLALITTGGVHLTSQPPFDMKDPDGDPTFREIPKDTASADLTITHNYYDHADADKDINIVFPIERVAELKRVGEIGEVNSRHFSFMGHILNRHVDTLMTDTAPAIAAALKKDGVDIAILTPAWGLCNQSVGLIQRVIEAIGIATISITLSTEISKKVRPPRALYPGFPLGHPIGFPGRAFRQLQVLRLLLKYLEKIDSPGTVIDLNLTDGNDPATTYVT